MYVGAYARLDAHNDASCMLDTEVGCGGPQHMHHLLNTCRLASVTKYRVFMRAQYLRWHYEYLRSLIPGSDRYARFNELTNRLCFGKILTYTDPPDYPPQTRQQIMRLIVNLYRIVVGYHRYRHYVD